MRFLTVVIENPTKDKLQEIRLGGEFIGGKITAMAAYDCIEALEIAEDALIDDNEDREVAHKKLSKFGVES